MRAVQNQATFLFFLIYFCLSEHMETAFRKKKFEVKLKSPNCGKKTFGTFTIPLKVSFLTPLMQEPEINTYGLSPGADPRKNHGVEFGYTLEY